MKKEVLKEEIDEDVDADGKDQRAKERGLYHALETNAD